MLKQHTPTTTRWRLLALLALILALALPPARTFAEPQVQVPLLVDLDDDSELFGCKAEIPRDCSLRGAIILANVLTGAVISFDPSIKVIRLQRALPTLIGHAARITGVAGLPRVDGLAIVGGDVLSLNGQGLEISGLSIVNGPPGVVGAPSAAIRVLGGERITISGNYIGTLPPAPYVTGCLFEAPEGAVTRGTGFGIAIDSAVRGSGSSPAVLVKDNTIGCQSSFGVLLRGTEYVRVEANLIGVNAAGVRLPSIGAGVYICQVGTRGARYNHVHANVIAGNRGVGVMIVGTGTNDVTSTAYNSITGNWIGLDASGAAAPNSGGIHMMHGAFQNRVGGTRVEERNIISGNGFNGVTIDQSTANGVLGNYIGTDPTGMLAVPNEANGVVVSRGTGNVVGGYVALFLPQRQANVISGNGLNGVVVSGAADTLVVGNIIGPNAPQGAALQSAALEVAERERAPSRAALEGVAPPSIELDAALEKALASGLPLALGSLPPASDERPLAASPEAGGGVRQHIGVVDQQLSTTTVITGNVIAGSEVAGIILSSTTRPGVFANTIMANGPSGLQAITVTDGVVGTVDGGPPQRLNIIRSHTHYGIYVADSRLRVGLNLVELNQEVGVMFTNLWGSSLESTSVAANGSRGVLVERSQGVLIKNVLLVSNGVAGLEVRNSVATTLDGGLIGANGTGILVTGAQSQGNRFFPLYLVGGRGLALDLGGDGFTPNDPGDGDSGPNALLNYPDLISISGRLLTGRACPGCTVRVHAAVGSPQHGGGLGQLLGTVRADGNGAWSFAAPEGYAPLRLALLACEGACALGANMSEPRPLDVVYLPLLDR